MEKTSIDNKLMKDLKKYVEETTESIPKAMDLAEQIVKSNMDDKEYARFKAFQKKYNKLYNKGDFKALDELIKHYNGE